MLRQRTSEALDKGVFGSPFFLVDGEPFWGWDRLPMLESWLAHRSPSPRKPDFTMASSAPTTDAWGRYTCDPGKDCGGIGVEPAQNDATLDPQGSSGKPGRKTPREVSQNGKDSGACSNIYEHSAADIEAGFRPETQTRSRSRFKLALNVFRKTHALAYQRRALLLMDAGQLKDIGLSRCDAEQEAKRIRQTARRMNWTALRILVAGKRPESDLAPARSVRNCGYITKAAARRDARLPAWSHTSYRTSSDG